MKKLPQRLLEFGGSNLAKENFKKGYLCGFTDSEDEFVIGKSKKVLSIIGRMLLGIVCWLLFGVTLWCLYEGFITITTRLLG